jgi:hypothetical protein
MSNSFRFENADTSERDFRVPTAFAQPTKRIQRSDRFRPAVNGMSKYQPFYKAIGTLAWKKLFEPSEVAITPLTN